MGTLCSAAIRAPGLTILCELEHNHAGPHHGHIDAGPEPPDVPSWHYAGPRSIDWIDRLYIERLIARTS